MKCPVLIAYLLIMFCASANSQTIYQQLGPIVAPGIKPVVVDEGVSAEGYHGANRPIVNLNGPAPWIWSAPGTRAAGPTSVTCFRGWIDLESAPVHVDSWISADWHYRLWINGRIVSRGPADPGVDYPGGKNRGNTGVYFCDYRNITSYLHTGKNIISAEVFTDRLSEWYGSSGTHGFMFKADVQSGTGADRTFSSDSSWKSMQLGYFAGSTDYIASAEPAAWRGADFDDSAWAACAPIDSSPWPNLLTSRLDTPMEAVFPFQSIVRDSSGQTTVSPNFTPDKPYLFQKDGSFGLYCGRVISGYVTMVVKGGAGASVNIALDERNGPGGHRGMTIHLTGSETAIESPFYSSFSVVNVTASNVTTPIKIESLHAVFISDPVEYVGSFACSDDYLNRLWKAARWQTQMCMQDHYLDSPDHQEPISDFGDYLIEEKVNDYAFAEPALVRQDLYKFGSLLLANDYINFHTSYSLLWLQSLVNEYSASGDNSLIVRLAPIVYGLIDKFTSWRGPNGLISEAPDYMFMDWVTINGIPCHHPPPVIGQGYMTAFYYEALADASQVARLAGNTEKVKEYQNLRNDVRTAFNRELWSEQQGLYRDGKPFQSSVPPSRWLPADVDMESFSAQVNSLAVLYGLAPADRSAAIMTKVMNDAPVNAEPYFYYFVFGALQTAGLFDSLAVGQMHRWTINPETGTFSEMWGGGDWSHGWGSAPAVYMSSTILGVRPGSPGYSDVAISPTICGLAYAKGVVPTPHGPVDVSWSVTSAGMKLAIAIPATSTATVVLPLKSFSSAAVAVDGRKRSGDSALPILLPGGHHMILLSGKLTAPAPSAADVTSSGVVIRQFGELTYKSDPSSAAAFEADLAKNSLAALGQTTCMSVIDTHDNGNSGGSNADAIRNGTTLNGSGGADTADDGKTYRGYGTGSSLIFTLNTSLNPSGYDITKILTFAGHGDGRASQNYSISAAFTKDPANFVTLIPSAKIYTSGGSTEVVVAQLEGGVITGGDAGKATGVAAVRFDFLNGPVSFNVYREIQLLGTPTK